jgi:hypothetical protein
VIDIRVGIYAGEARDALRNFALREVLASSRLLCARVIALGNRFLDQELHTRFGRGLPHYVTTAVRPADLGEQEIEFAWQIVQLFNLDPRAGDRDVPKLTVADRRAVTAIDLGGIPQWLPRGLSLFYARHRFSCAMRLLLSCEDELKYLQSC